MHKRLLLILITALALGTLGRATQLTVSLSSPTLAGAPGSVLDFTGVLTNTTGADLFLNADSFNLASFAPSAIDDTPFFTNAPLFLSAGASTGTIDLFTVTIPNGFTPGNYAGFFQVIGGATSNDQALIGGASFTVTVQPAASGVPEPSSFTLVFLSAALLGGLRKWRLLPGQRG